MIFLSIALCVVSLAFFITTISANKRIDFIRRDILFLSKRIEKVRDSLAGKDFIYFHYDLPTLTKRINALEIFLNVEYKEGITTTTEDRYESKK